MGTNRIRWAGLTVLSSLVVAGCGDSTGPGTPAVSLSFASDVGASASAGAGAFAPPDQLAAPITDGTNTLDITTVQIVLRRIDLKSASTADCNVDPKPAGCESFRSEPILVTVPVNGTVAQAVEIDIPPGTYTEVKFDIHEVTGDDAAFLAANPTMEGKSITVVGTYNGAAFSFETNMSQEQKLTLVPSLVVGDGDPATNVTIRFDVSTWFRDGQGNLFNPATASTGEPNESVAEENIQNSIKAFEDKDKDGDETDEG